LELQLAILDPNTQASADQNQTITNSAPVVSGPVTVSVTEDQGAVLSSLPLDKIAPGIEDILPPGCSGDFGPDGSIVNAVNLLAHASDSDSLDTLSVIVPADLPPGVSYVHVPASSTPTGYYGALVVHPASDLLVIDPSDPSLQSLAQGEQLQIVVDYGISDGAVTTAAQAIFTVTGTNDAPVVSGQVFAAATEDAGLVTVDALANASDVDHGAMLVVTDPPPPPPEVDKYWNHGVIRGEGEVELRQGAESSDGFSSHVTYDFSALPSSVTFDAATNTFTLDSTDAAYQHLSAGETMTVQVNYGVTDGIAPASFASASFTITGANDAPVVSGPATFSVQEDLGVQSVAPISGETEIETPETELELHDLAEKDGSGIVQLPNSINLLANASDVDHLDKLSVVDVPVILPPGVTYVHVEAQTIPSTVYYGAPTVIPAFDALVIDPSDASLQSLAEGEVITITVDYGISDGTVTTAAQAIFTVTGTNDAPLVAGMVLAAGDEDGASMSADALANASDVDHGAVLTVTATPLIAAPDDYWGRGAGEAERQGNDPTDGFANHVAYDFSALPSSITFDVATNTFTLDSTDAAYQHLSAGETMTVQVNYGVTDGIAPVASFASVAFTITGTNDAPVVSGPATATVHEELGGASVDSSFSEAEVQELEFHGLAAAQIPNAINLLANASDVDHLDTLSVVGLPAVLPAGVTYVHIPASSTPTGYYGAMVEHPEVNALVIDPSDASFDSLAEGEIMTISVEYGITDGTVTTPTSAVFTVIGTNDVPVVSGEILVAATEDNSVVTIDALANATDVDHGTVLNVTGAPPSATVGTEVSGPYYGALKVQNGNGANSTNSADDPASDPTHTGAAVAPAFDLTALPAGVTFDAATNSFSLDASDAAYQHLSAGQVQTVTVNYGITDGIVTTAASARFTVTGTNDAPVVTGALAFSAAEDGLAQIVNPLANVSDVDSLDVLQVVSGPMPAGLQLVTVPGGYYQPDVTVINFNPHDSSFQSLAQGEVKTFTWDYQVTDGHVLAAASATFTVTGVNDAPVVAVPAGATMLEDAATVTVDALANATDVDHGAVLSVVNVPVLLPVGIAYDAVTHTFSINPADPVFQSLAQGEAQTFSVAYGITDGAVTTATSVNFTVIGVNDAPIVSGPVTGSPNEDGNVVSINALGNASDIDDPQFQGHGLFVKDVPSTLPDGVSYDAVSGRFSLDPSNAAYQYLSKGETVDVTIKFTVSDGYVDVPTSAIFTVTGKNDVPIVSGVVQGGTLTESGAPVSLDLLAAASDVDHRDVLNVKLAQGSNVVASVASGTWTAPIAFAVSNNHLMLDPAQFNALRGGEILDLTFNYTVTDGNTQGGDAAATAHLTIAGENDAPTSIVLSSAHIAENSAAGSVVGQLTAADPDHNETFTYQLLNDPNGFFSISGNSLVVAQGAAIDYEQTASETIQVQVVDSLGLSFVQSILIAIDNVAGVAITGTSKDDVYNATSAVATTVENDTVDGNNGNDLIDGRAGNDLLNGGSGNDTIVGGSGGDTITGGVGNDNIDAGAGDDTIIVSGGDAQLDTINGGNTGEVKGDTIVVQGSGAVTFANFDTNASSIENWVGNSSNISGTGNADTIDLSHLSSVAGLTYVDAGSGDDSVTGSAVADDLRGNSGNDSLSGAGGADVLNGGAGVDTLSGGTGADRFIYNVLSDIASGSLHDTIKDFSHAEGDRIDLSGIDANSSIGSDQAFTFIGAAAFGNHAGELHYTLSASGLTLSGDINGDGKADFSIDLLGVSTLDSHDFLL